MSFKLLINDSKVEVKDMSFFQRGIILPDRTIVETEVLKDIVKKPMKELTKGELTKVEPYIIIPFNNGALVAKGILYFKDQELYEISETYTNFILFNKTEFLVFKPKELIENEMKEVFKFDSEFKDYDFLGMANEEPLEENMPITLPRIKGFYIKHKNQYLPKNFENEIKTLKEHGVIEEIEFSNFVTRNSLNFARDVFLEAFMK